MTARSALTRAPVTVLQTHVTLLVGLSRIYERAARTIRAREALQLWRHALRVIRFGLVGFTVAVFAGLLLATLIGGITVPEVNIFGYQVPRLTIGGFHLLYVVAFVIEGFVAVNLNFLGSRYFTWADRFSGPGFWKSMGLAVGYALLTIVLWLRWLGVAWLFRVLVGRPPAALRSRTAFWRRRDSRELGFWRTWIAFWTARSITFGINQALLNFQVYLLHLPTQLAYVAGLIVAAAFNYTANDMYVFRAARKEQQFDYATIPIKAGGRTLNRRVCIVAPCKGNSPGEIHDFLMAIHNQEYCRQRPRNVQVILAGDPNDSAWRGIPLSFPDRNGNPGRPNFALNIVEVALAGKGRDSNMKRSAGLALAFADVIYGASSVTSEDVRNQILVYADPDIQPGEHWLSRIVSRIVVSGYEFVAGPLKSVEDLPGWYGKWGRFWARFIDRTSTGSKTPRVDREIVLTMDNIGQYKPPVTANLAFTYGVWELIGEPRPDFRNSYEDYEFCWRALESGVKILFDPLLEVPRTHRVGFWKLLAEYLRSGEGFRDFAAEYPESPFTTLRLVSLMTLPWVIPIAGIALALFPLYATVLGCAAILSLILTNLLAARRIDGVLYPFIGGLFTLRFIYGVCQAVQARAFSRVAFPTVIMSPRTRTYVPFKGVLPYAGVGP